MLAHIFCKFCNIISCDSFNWYGIQYFCFDCSYQCNKFREWLYIVWTLSLLCFSGKKQHKALEFFLNWKFFQWTRERGWGGVGKGTQMQRCWNSRVGCKNRGQERYQVTEPRNHKINQESQKYELGGQWIQQIRIQHMVPDQTQAQSLLQC